MRVAIITQNLSAGGAERVISQLLSEWHSAGIECHLILLRKRTIAYAIPDGVFLYELDLQGKNKISRKINELKNIRDIVKKINPDIVLSLPEEIGIYTIGALLGTKIPVVVSERNNPHVMPYKKITRLFRKLLYPFSHGFIFQTREAASYFSKKIQKKGVVLPNPLELSRIPSVYTGEREKVVVGAGRLFPQKNFKLLIDAFAEFYKTHPDYKLIIYGEGHMRSELEDYASKHLKPDTYSFPGIVLDLLERMRKASMFVLSSDYEGMPNALIEAMAMGLPSISTDCPSGGSRELIANGENGILVPVSDSHKMAEAMSFLADNSEMAAKISKESAKVKFRLDSKVISKKWLDYLHKTVLRSNKK